MRGERALRFATFAVLALVAVPTACGGDVERTPSKTGGAGGKGGSSIDAAGYGGVHTDGGGFGGSMDAAPYGGGYDGGGYGGADGAYPGGYDGGGYGGADGAYPGGSAGCGGYGGYQDGAPPCGGFGGTIDASLDGSSPCSGLDEATCNAMMQKQLCTAYYGYKVPGGSKQFAVCDSYCVGGAAMSCSVDPNGVCWLFPETCHPTGWTYYFDCYTDAAACVGWGIPDGG